MDIGWCAAHRVCSARFANAFAHETARGPDVPPVDDRVDVCDRLGDVVQRGRRLSLRVVAEGRRGGFELLSKAGEAIDVVVDDRAEGFESRDRSGLPLLPFTHRRRCRSPEIATAEHRQEHERDDRDASKPHTEGLRAGEARSTDEKTESSPLFPPGQDEPERTPHWFDCAKARRGRSTPATPDSRWRPASLRRPSRQAKLLARPSRQMQEDSSRVETSGKDDARRLRDVRRGRRIWRRGRNIGRARHETEHKSRKTHEVPEPRDPPFDFSPPSEPLSPWSTSG